MPRVLAIDPGTKCGWAVVQDSVLVASGTRNLAGKNWESRGMRFIRAGQLFKDLIAMYQPDHIAFESVKRWASSDAALIYNAIISQLMIACELASVEYTSFAATAVKKYVTGNGRADKKDMIAWANNKYTIMVVDDNEADAIAVANLALDGLTSPQKN